VSMPSVDVKFPENHARGGLLYLYTKPSDIVVDTFASGVHGSPMIVIAIKIAAITQPAAIHRPPKRIHRRLSKKEKADMAFLRDLGTMGLSWALSCSARLRNGY